KDPFTCKLFRDIDRGSIPCKAFIVSQSLITPGGTGGSDSLPVTPGYTLTHKANLLTNTLRVNLEVPLIVGHGDKLVRSTHSSCALLGGTPVEALHIVDVRAMTTRRNHGDRFIIHQCVGNFILFLQIRRSSYKITCTARIHHAAECIRHVKSLGDHLYTD